MDIVLAEEAEKLSDNIFKLAVIENGAEDKARFEKLCKILDKALERKTRREYKANLIFH